MLNKKTVLVLTFFFSILLVIGVGSSAVIFEDDFNDNNIDGWSADCFGDCSGEKIYNNVGTNNNADNYDDGTAHAFIKDDTALYQLIPIYGYENISFDYCRRTNVEGSSDRLRIGYKTGSYSNVWSEWTQIEEVGSNNWSCVSNELPNLTGNSSVYIAFFLDNGNSDRGFIDNVEITGDLIVNGGNGEECSIDTDCPGSYSGPQYCEEGDLYKTLYSYSCIENSCLLNGASELVEEGGCLQNLPPTCSVDFLAGNDGISVFDLNDYYFNDSGIFYAYGSASSNDDMCYLDWVGYNRTSPEFSNAPGWTNANNQDNWKIWRTNLDYTYLEGEHTICCKVESKDCVGVGCNTYSTTSCTTFCIDETAPEKVTGVIFNNKPTETCGNENIINYAPEFSWNAIEDYGCAPIHYELKLFFSNGTLIETYNLGENTSFEVPVEHLISGEDYYVEVRAVDEAGNEGEWSNASEHVWYDITPPVVKITGETWSAKLGEYGDWYNRDFYVFENDTDNIGVWKCQLAVSGNGSTPTNYIDVPCNSFHLINISEFCPEDGLNICWVRKQAIDYACNYNNETEGHKWDLDRVAPITYKKVGDPKIESFGDWILKLINGFFVNDKTYINLYCEDNLSGCNETYYKIDFQPFYENETYGDWVLGDVIEYNNQSFALTQGDGLYNITYWSVDNAGNIEEAKFEVDKVDLYAPKTSMIFTGLIVLGLNYNSENFDFPVVMNFTLPSYDNEPIINLSATDSEVGVNKTWYQILVPGEGSHIEWYGTTTNLWYENETLCEDENSNCESTSWELSPQFLNMSCDNEWCEYDNETGIVFWEECDHKVCYYSEDRLGNVEEVQCTVFSIDGEGPLLALHNPSLNVANSIRTCSLNVLAESLDMKSGINESIGVEAYLINGIDEMIKLERNPSFDGKGSSFFGDMYSGNFDLEGIPAGDYTLRIVTEDNLGNQENISRAVKLESGIFIDENWSPSCLIGGEGGLCELEFRACVRNSTSMDFSMTKIKPYLANVVDLNATLWTEGGWGMVGQLNDTFNGYESFPDKVQFSPESCEVINGRTSFIVSLNFTKELMETISNLEDDEASNYKFDYEVNSYLDESCLVSK